MQKWSEKVLMKHTRLSKNWKNLFFCFLFQFALSLCCFLDEANEFENVKIEKNGNKTDIYK